MQFLSKLFFLFLLAISAVGCEGDALTKFNGNHPENGSAGFDCRREGDNCKVGFACDNGSGQCVAATSNDCRQTGCSSALVCNEYTGVCQAPPQCFPSCTGRECGSDGCGGQCGTCGAGSVCTALTGECEMPSGNDCRQVGCPAAWTCNTSTGVCQDLSSGGAGECELRSLDKGVEFTLYASGISDLASAESGWSNPIKSVGGVAKFSSGGLPLVAFNAKRSDGLWEFGWDGIDPSYVTKVVGNWELRCGLKVYQWLDGLAQANCSNATLQSQGKCLWSGALGKYRVVAATK